MRGLMQAIRTLPVAALLAVVAACTDDTAGPDNGGTQNPAGVNEYVATLGSWATFAPPEAASNTPVGADTTTMEVVVEPNQNNVLQPVTYVCTSRLYSMTATPNDIVLYEPNAGIMWVGNLIQGRSYKDGQGSFQELSIRQRAPLKLSIDLLTGANSATVENPALGSVNAAIGDLIQRATDAGHRSGSSINYRMETTHSVQQSALALGISAQHLGASARANLQMSRAANQRTLSVHFVQKMFTIAIELPQSPASVFSGELTDALLQQQITAGNLGPSNPPVYLASITYGRVLTYNLTSSHSEERMRAAIQGSYTGLTGGVSGYTEAQLRETLDRENVRLTSIGGEGQNVLDLIVSGNLKSYFATDAPLTTARPISYQLNFLGDNSIAKVAEKTSYSLRTCAPRADIPGPFRFLPAQNLSAPLPTPFQMVKGDIDGDGIADLVFNHLTAGSNEIAVARGSDTGAFEAPVRFTHSAPAPSPEGWTRYILQTADITGDGRTDLVWHSPDRPWRVYTAVGNAGGSFSFPDRTQHASNLGTEFSVNLADIDGDGAKDLVWNRTINGSNLTYVAPSLRDGRFNVNVTGFTNTRGSGWAGYQLAIADVNGDGRDDLVWNILNDVSTNRVYVGLSQAAGGFNFLTPQDHPTDCCWSTYNRLIGDFNRDRASDILWITTNHIHRGSGQGTGRFNYPVGQAISGNDNTTPGIGPFQLYTGDVDGDGAHDVIWNRRSGTANRIAVTRGVAGQTVVDRSEPAQMHPDAANWLQAQLLVGDFNGDDQDDVLWVIPGGTTRVFLAIGKTPGT